tara:strand:- start:3687 stop:4769 length:1083 start_codon:yes stop_codon:yes gene_type:complete
MTFFNKKEEVIEIQLTQYGKYLVSLGKFKPTQYAFFDADIIYDTSYVDLSEAQNDSELRIKNAVRPKTQYVFSPGPETEITKANSVILENKQDLAQAQKHLGPEFDDTEVEVGMNPVLTEEDMLRFQFIYAEPAALKDYVLSHPLGTSEYGSSYVPAWSVKFLNSELTGSKPTLSGSNGISRIPQLFLTSSYETFITFVDEDGTYIKDNVEDELDLGVFADMPYGDSRQSGHGHNVTVYQDDSTFQVKPHYLLVEAEEKNSLFEKENFDIEVYKVDGDQAQLLYFYEPGVDSGPITSKFVDYYFEVLADYEIDNDLFCASINVQKRKHIFSDQDRTFNCFEAEGAEFNIYDIEIDEEEPC